MRDVFGGVILDARAGEEEDTCHMRRRIHGVDAQAILDARAGVAREHIYRENTYIGENTYIERTHAQNTYIERLLSHSLKDTFS